MLHYLLLPYLSIDVEIFNDALYLTLLYLMLHNINVALFAATVAVVALVVVTAV